MPPTATGTRFSSLRAFGYPAYVRIWTGAFVSNVGTWVQAISVGIYVTETTGKAGWTGTVAGLTYLPAVLLGPIGGALADRFERRSYIAPLTVVQALSSAGLALLSATGHLPLLAIAALVFLNGCASALSVPAFNALLSELVEPKDLLSAVSLSSAQFNLARIVGPMLAAAILTYGSLTAAFVVNALSYLGVLLALASLARSTRPASGRAETIRAGIARGLQVARTDPGIRVALPMVGVLAFLIAPFIGLMPAYAIKCLGRGAREASLMAVGQGVGALIASGAANALAERLGVRGLLERTLIIVGPVAIAYWLSPTYAIAFGLLALLGAFYILNINALSATCMGRVSRDLQARISSLYSMTLSGGYAMGLAAQGWLSDRLGLRVVPAVAAGIVLAIALILRQRASLEAIDAPCEHGPAAVVEGAPAP